MYTAQRYIRFQPPVLCYNFCVIVQESLSSFLLSGGECFMQVIIFQFTCSQSSVSECLMAVYYCLCCYPNTADQIEFGDCCGKNALAP